MNIEEKAIKIAISTVFTDCFDRELVIYKWLAGSYITTVRKYDVPDCFKDLSNFDLFNIVEDIRERIVAHFGDN